MSYIAKAVSHEGSKLYRKRFVNNRSFESEVRLQSHILIKGLFVQVLPSPSDLARACSFLQRHFCNVIFATSFWFAESSLFSVSVKTSGIDHIAVLADSNEMFIRLHSKIRFIRQPESLPVCLMNLIFKTSNDRWEEGLRLNWESPLKTNILHSSFF